MKSAWLCILFAIALLDCRQISAVLSPITLRAGVLHAPPFAIINESDSSFGGFQLDLLERLRLFALDDNIELNFILEKSPPQYGPALDLVANDCNTTENPNLLEDCRKFDLIIGDYYCNPGRSVRVDFTPSWLRTTMSTVKYTDKEGQDYTTLTEVSRAGENVCVPDGTYLMTVVMAKFPEANYIKCATQQACLDELKAENCALYAEDELQLRYRAANDGQLQVTGEQFNTQYMVWPMSYNLERNVSTLMKKWIYAAVSNATLDELYFRYFQRQNCPIGTAGENCELPCDPDHGESNSNGVCICVSTRWTGPDCSIEIQEDVNLIPFPLKLMGYIMFAINVIIVVCCAIWLLFNITKSVVVDSQPVFLALVLLGCFISSSTILALGLEDSGYGAVPGCAVIPWLYSIGFSITFGALFAKILRMYLVFKDVTIRRTVVTPKELFIVIGCVLFLDVAVLIVWTIMDPLEWRRSVLTADLYGHPLVTEGYCSSDHWKIFSSIIGALHVSLMVIACGMCYTSRHITTQITEGKYVALAMVSNFQVLIVGVPVLILLGANPGISYFVRSIIIWMNDLVVVVLIFGNLIYVAHFGCIVVVSPSRF